jgi:ferredoxin-type protein NapH
MIKRRIAQVVSTILYNAGLISDLPRRYMPSRFCVPGLNCQFCPASVAGCPLNYLQGVFAGRWRRLPISSIAWFLLFTIALGRVICGWLCPFGLFQDLLDKVPLPKIHKNKVTRGLSYVKYLFLFGVVCAIPIYMSVVENRTVLAFCRYVCPNLYFDQTLYALMKGQSLGANLLAEPAFLFLIAIVIAGLFIFRPFCRFVCPLGAFYGFFNKTSLFSIKVDKTKCVNCHACEKVCPMDIKKVGDHECISCGKCKSICHFGAIHYGRK